MSEVLNDEITSKNNISKDGLESLSNKEKEYSQQNESFESQNSSTSDSNNNDLGNYQGIKSDIIEKNECSDDSFENNQTQKRKHSAPSETEKFFLNFMKIERETRGAYFNKLLLKGFLNLENRESNMKTNRIFIFDWDDTLLCTTVLSPGGYFDDNRVILPGRLKKIKHLESLVKKLLTNATEKGDTYIITNSEQGWVEYSCKRFFPNVYDLLSKIKIISARALYEKKYPNNYKTWKNMAFNDIIKNYDLNIPSNVICMGDSTYEMEAAHALSNKFQDGFIKAIKFKELPRVDELISQLNLILEKFDFIYSACKNWTITIDKKRKNSNV
jgi:hypothetical protein